MEKTIFISYASEDAARAKQVQRFLQKRGWSVWIDDAGIRGAARWAGEIEKAIRAADAMVLLLSHHAATSEWVDRELVAATEQGLPIVTAELEQTPLSAATEFLLRARQRIRLTTGDNRLQRLNELDDAIIRALEERRQSKPGRMRLWLGGAIATIGALGIVAAIALFGFGFVQFASGSADPDAELPVFIGAFGVFAASGFVAAIGQRIRRSARLAALRRASTRP